MKLGVKMFFCITVFFSAAFLSCGAMLISIFYETAIEKEIESTSQQFQYNKFVIQAALITRGDGWLKDAADGLSNIDFIASDMNGTAALFSLDNAMLFSSFPDQTDFSSLLERTGSGAVSYQFVEIQGRMHLMIAGSVNHNNMGACLITGADIQKILQQQEQLIQRFGCLYAAALFVGIFLIIGLSLLLTNPINRLSTAAQRIADGNYAERVTVYGNDEVGQLAQTFNQMACAIEDKIKELSESARQKEDFAANLAHELKTPLTSVIGYADRIYQKDLPRDAQKQAAWHIWNEGMRLEALSLKLMDLTILNHKEFVLQETDASQMLDELASDVEYLMAEKNISFQSSAQQAYIKAEYDLFKTLFLNIIDNAVKAGASRICVAGRAKAALMYTIEITDNGCGIPPDEIKRITEAFYMVDKSRSRKLHGAGLGLALSQKIAQIHGAALTFESDGRSGTRVTIDLPVSPPPPCHA